MKKIVIAMIEAGGGHKSPALAVEESLYEICGSEVQVEVLDFCKAVGADKIDRMHKKGWERALGKPGYVKVMYGILDFFGPLTRAVLYVLLLGFFKKAERWLEEHRPDIFFSTHFMTAAAAIYARKKSRSFSFPIIMYATEPNDISSLWLWKKVDRLIVSSDRAAEKAVRKGMKEEQVLITGYPIRPSFFSNRRNEETIRKELGLLPKQPTLLISAGAQGLPKMTDYVYTILEQGFPVNCIVVCGKNERLFEELSGMNVKRNNQTRMVPLGFVSNMNELLSVSDLVLLKAGPASTYEALFFGVPVIFFHFVENEKANIDFILKNGVGWYAQTPAGLAELLDEVLASGGAEIEIRKRKIEQLELHNGAPEIAKYLLDHYMHQKIYLADTPRTMYSCFRRFLWKK